MKLIDLVPYLTNSDTIAELYTKEKMNIESEALIIYMEKELGVNSEIRFFTIEETDDSLVYEKNGVKYVQLFPLNYAVELVKSDLDLSGKGYNNLDIADRLIEYRIKDA